MADEITNTVLLQHMHAMKNSLELKIEDVHVGLDRKIMSLAETMRRGFEEARQHRQVLQEDLEATMRMVYTHEKKLARR